jgi:hypothetical protein
MPEPAQAVVSGSREWPTLARLKALARSEPRVAWAVLGAMMLTAGGWMLYLTRGTTFHYDEWSVVLHRPGHSLEAFFRPHSEHIAALPVVIFKGLFELVGLGTYWPYQLLPITLHLVCALLIFLFARRRMGEWWALIPAGLVISFGAAWEDILWPFQIGYIIPVVTFLGAVLLLGRNDLRADVGAAILVTAGVLSSSFGVALAIGVAASILFGPRRIARLAGVVGIPLALYLLWNHFYGVARFSWAGVPDVPRLVLDLVAATLAAIFGVSTQFGPILAALFVVALLLHVLRNKPLTPALAGALTGALAAFALMALFRPNFLVSRYYYPSGVLLILALVELAPARLPSRVTARGLGVGVAAAGIVLIGQIGYFLEGGKFFRDWARFVPTSLGALELARDHVDPTFTADPVRAPDVDAAHYFAATKKFGSPADSPAEIMRRPEDARQNADSVLSAALRIGMVPAERPAEPGSPPEITAAVGGTARTSDGCIRLGGSTPRRSVEIRLPATGIWLRPEAGANAEVRFRRFGATYPRGDQPPGQALFSAYVIPPQRVFLGVPLLRIPGAKGRSIVVPRDRAPDIPWYAQITTDRPVAVCSLGG